MKRALLLNADYQPLNFISGKRAISLMCKGRAEVVQFDDRTSAWPERYATPSSQLQAPATLRLVNKITRRWQTPRFHRWILFNRDNWECQYCGVSLSKESITIDHVKPKSKGGDTSWKNCVTSCKRCNRKKGNLTLREANMVLRRQPAEPTQYHIWDTIKCSSWHDDWTFFLGDGK